VLEVIQVVVVEEVPREASEAVSIDLKIR